MYAWLPVCGGSVDVSAGVWRPEERVESQGFRVPGQATEGY